MDGLRIERLVHDKGYTINGADHAIREAVDILRAVDSAQELQKGNHCILEPVGLERGVPTLQLQKYR
jgi:hypothetical protein